MNKKLTYLIISIALVSNFLMAQAPPEPLRNVIVHAVVSLDDSTNVYSYNYAVNNPADNSISISVVQIDVTLDSSRSPFPDTTWGELPRGFKCRDPRHEWSPGESQLRMVRGMGDEVVSFGLFSPPGWDIYGLAFDSKTIGLIQSNVVAAWSRWRMTVPPIAPGETLGGFQLTSYGLPGIRKMVFKPDFGQMVMAGLVPDDWITQESDSDEVLRDKTLKEESLNCLAMTIGPTTVPTEIDLIGFNNILKDYVSQSVQLGWLIDPALTQSLNELLMEADQYLHAEDYAQARQTLLEFMQIIQTSTPEQRTSEAEGLLYYNAKYLYNWIYEWWPLTPTIEATPVSAERALNQVQHFSVRLWRKEGEPVPFEFVEAEVLAGPHQGYYWADFTDALGLWSFNYKGERLGTDEIQVKSIKPGNHGPGWERYGPRIYVKWVGGPDLTLKYLYPPAVRIPQSGDYIPIDESTVNIGTVDAPESKTRYYLSVDKEVDESDFILGERIVPLLQPQQENPYKKTIFASGIEPGFYWVLACADADNEIIELNELNNCETTIVQIFFLTEEIENLPPDCSQAKATPDSLWPPNHKFKDINIIGITDPKQDPITITINYIKQDEPLNGLGDGDTSPDGILQPLQVRSERSGTANGRVYHIGFIASDDKGGQCSGITKVCVPHDQGSSSECIDDGALYDSTQTIP